MEIVNEAATAAEDERWMRVALEEARRALADDEIPIGAVVVSGGRILGRGHNMTEALCDVTAHAEMLALTAAATASGGKYMPRATLYVTIEPCVMCAGAIGWSQIGRIVYGAPEEKRGYRSLGAARSPFHPSATVVGGVLADDCRALMQEFFRPKRR
ncbi:MAG: nucleoside deaminase [Clostridium sp.]|nr:nucleoside deaminase [Clostridium sp.]